jgi:hypothetical protein
MAISLGTLVVRHERRVQLVFTAPLAAAAFTTLSLYTVTNTDALAPDPPVVAAFIVPSNPNAVELALGLDLNQGAAYLLSAVGVPAIDTSVTPAGSSLALAMANSVAVPQAEVVADDTQALLFGVDIVHDGADYVEDVTGDLATITGPGNAAQAVRKRIMSDGVAWNPDYGGKPRQYVDGAPGELPTLRGDLLRQIYKDDRVKSATASAIVEDPTDPAASLISFDVRFIGVNGTVPINVSVPGT